MVKDWNEIVGQKNIQNHLKRAVKALRPSHAYLFYGDEGIGKRTVASLFAKSLQCENIEKQPDGVTPCGKCRSCLQFDSKNQPDVFWVSHEKAEISIDDVRNQIISPMGIRPYSSRFRIFLVDEAEKMNEKAQNALLKTLEEPPEYGIIILMGNNPESFLNTIVSRSVALGFTPAPAEEIKGFLMKEKRIPDYQAGIAAFASGGCPGLAYSWADSEEFAEKRGEAEKILVKLGSFERSQAFLQAQKWAKDKARIEFFLGMCENWIHDVLLLKSVSEMRRSFDSEERKAEERQIRNAMKHIMFTQEMDVLNAQAAKLSYEYFERLLRAADELRSRLKFNVSTELAFADFLVNMC